jgi:two-component system response regulator RegA
MGAAAPDPSSGSKGVAHPGAGRKLLLVDDDPPLRRSMARALARRGFEVVAVESLAEARDRARTYRPQYAVLDMRLADGIGLDLVQLLREIRPEVRIVIVTGYGNVATAVAAIKAASVDCLAKPVDADDVIAALLKSGEGLPPLRDDPI